jgi:hypothetical protein
VEMFAARARFNKACLYDRAKLCPTPKTCYLSFRMVINEHVSAELLPYVWKVRGNVHIEVRKLRRQNDMPSVASILSGVSAFSRPHWNPSVQDEDVIGHAKLLTVRQFYYIFCFLSGA